MTELKIGYTKIYLYFQVGHSWVKTMFCTFLEMTVDPTRSYYLNIYPKMASRMPYVDSKLRTKKKVLKICHVPQFLLFITKLARFEL